MDDYITILEKKTVEALWLKYGVTAARSSRTQMYRCLSESVRDILIDKYRSFQNKCREENGKRVCYLSMEFLVGSSLKNNLFNLGIYDECDAFLNKYDHTLDDVASSEKDAALGNGGLGRLAASYLDAIASLDYCGEGYSILYEYGFFRQMIDDGEQKETSDTWLDTGDVWLLRNYDKKISVKIGGELCCVNGEEKYDGYTELQADAYDMFVSGYKSDAVSLLRLWRCSFDERFDMQKLVDGRFDDVLNLRSEAELVSMFLYPPDNTQRGRMLRLVQQYFFVSATVQSVIADHYREYLTVDNLSEHVSFHINDTHPSLCIPECIRVLCSEYSLSFDKAYEIVNRSVSYTNHTVMPEALEVWDEDLVKELLPRVYAIIKEINKRQSQIIYDLDVDQWDRISDISVISSGKIRMSNMSVLCSKKVNGVSKLHTKILREDIFSELSKNDPGKLINITNGISYRRWLCLSNKHLCSVLDDAIGVGYRERPYELSAFSSFSSDKGVLLALEEARYRNKLELCEVVRRLVSKDIDPHSMFDVQVKRLHEYKRQLLNVLKILSYYCELHSNVNVEIYPKTFVFAAKAAPTYYHAKRIIKLINKVSEFISSDPLAKNYLSVVFLPDYSVSLAQKIIPSADISEQISLAGKEASGTGNMKFMINGALTIGTYDGANVEICELVGEDNIYIFGITSQEAKAHVCTREVVLRKLEEDSRLQDVIELLRSGKLGDDFSDIADYLCDGKRPDPYCCIEDYQSYMRTYRQACIDYKNKKKHFSKSVVNIANAGYFSSDRAIEEYASKIWGLDKINS